jgi:hypothetical protein
MWILLVKNPTYGRSQEVEQTGVQSKEEVLIIVMIADMAVHQR